MPFGQRLSLGLTLVAAALSLETGLTDATLLMFDTLMGSLSRKAERRSQERQPAPLAICKRSCGCSPAPAPL